MPLGLRGLTWAGFGLLVAAAAVCAGGVALVVPDQMQPVDIILVLGGDGPPRAVRAAALFQAGLAPRVLVSGTGDCGAIRDAMTARGVPRAAIALECGSRTTFENAALSSPILAKAGVRSAILVTSWFHMRRALACFAAAAPGIVWGTAAAPAVPGGVTAPWAMLAASRALAGEWVKLAWYAWHYGVVPSSIARSRPP